MEPNHFKELLLSFYKNTYEWLLASDFKTQLGLILLCLILSYVMVLLLGKNFEKPEQSVPKKLRSFSVQAYQAVQRYLMPLMIVVTLSLAENLIALTSHTSWLISLTQTFAVIVIANRFLKHQIPSAVKRRSIQWIVVPLIFLYFMGWLDEVSQFLEGYHLTIGHITLSLNSLIRTVIFGVVLFWLGKASNRKGQLFIRNQKNLDLRSKELFAKLFEIALYIFIFILMLESVGLDITALAVFGGALGLGLGFGLQSIASNFISGIIILLDRSLSVGDHIELEDGKKGIVRELNMRSATVETFDGTDIIVPNETFISSTFTNWTHFNTKQRYSIRLQVAYDTDLHFLFDLIKKTVSQHPQVFSDESYPKEEWPDAEIESFGDSGINILIEYWMIGIDDGKNRVGADLMLMLWDAFKAHGIQIPYPQREVKILNSQES